MTAAIGAEATTPVVYPADPAEPDDDAEAPGSCTSNIWESRPGSFRRSSAGVLAAFKAVQCRRYGRNDAAATKG
jgi:hypothetical protein